MNGWASYEVGYVIDRPTNTASPVGTTKGSAKPIYLANEVDYLVASSATFNAKTFTVDGPYKPNSGPFVWASTS